MLALDDKHYTQKTNELNDRLYKMYNKVKDRESKLIEVKAKRSVVEVDKVTDDNIYEVLICFEKLYEVINDEEKRDFIE